MSTNKVNVKQNNFQGEITFGGDQKPGDPKTDNSFIHEYLKDVKKDIQESTKNDVQSYFDCEIIKEINQDESNIDLAERKTVT